MAEAGMTRTPVERALEKLAHTAPTSKKAIPCPLPDHDDKHPSAMRYPDGGWYCHGCNAYGSALDLYALKHGLTIAQALHQLDAFDPNYKPRPKPRARKVYLPDETRDLLLASSEFTERWEAAKLLAQVDPLQAQRDVVMSWDRLEPLDIPETLRLVGLIREVAQHRYPDHDPIRGVRQLLREIER